MDFKIFVNFSQNLYITHYFGTKILCKELFYKVLYNAINCSLFTNVL